MHTNLEQEVAHPKKSEQTKMSRCLFGDWPRREMLKLALPATDLSLSLPSCNDHMSTDIQAW
ncbi:MAG: hypothetical protein H6750_14015 [Nitrospiraceae bacterium]|nr:hypothetical protein [Nitrospira sp.]MCA9457898.1 hypothetical protein [Nitrospira sp.]MCB9775423.1 hypothetical protein [Nitrospiraceae bacterium]HQU28279.1 hypothetical protein [Nitrospirales bacterium]